MLLGVISTLCWRDILLGQSQPSSNHAVACRCHSSWAVFFFFLATSYRVSEIDFKFILGRIAFTPNFMCKS